MRHPLVDPSCDWIFFVYKVPSEPSRNRVAVWRELKRLGGHYVQQAACVLPDIEVTREALAVLAKRVDDLDGYSYTLHLEGGTGDQERLVEAFRAQSSSEYAELVEECSGKFVKEIEFERFRQNLTFEEAEEIRQDLEKIHRWFERVVDRDFFAAPGREDVDDWLDRCTQLLEAFEEDVYRLAQEGDG